MFQFNERKKKVISGLLTITLSFGNLYGYTNELLKPKDGSTLVDIGYNEGTIPHEVNINKTLVKVPAQTREIEGLIDLLSREKTTYSCSVDEENNKVCPIDQLTCSGSMVYDQGTAEEGHGSQVISATTSTITTTGTAPVTNTGTFNGYSDTSDQGAFAYEMNVHVYYCIVHSGTTYSLKVSPDSATCGYGDTIDSFSSNENISQVDLSVTSPETLNTTINVCESSSGCSGVSGPTYFGIPPNSFSADYSYTVGGTSSVTTTSLTCPPNYTLTGSTCTVDYTYYTYSCPEDFTGPTDTGGDCNAIGITLGSDGIYYCNSPVPPTTNCFKMDYTCPISGGECSKVADSNPLVENLFNGYIYDIGLSEEHLDSIRDQKSCPNSTDIDCANITLDNGGWVDSTLYNNKCQKALNIYSGTPELFGDYKITNNSGSISTTVSFPINISGTDLTNNRLTSSQIDTLYSNGWTYNDKFALKMFNMGSGCGGLNVQPLPDYYIITDQHGSTVSLAGTECGTNSYLIESNDQQYATILGVYDEKPTQLDFICDDFCLIGNPNNPLELADIDCGTGYAWDPNSQVCYEAIPGGTPDFENNLMIISRDNGYNADRNLCESDFTYKCDLPGFNYNVDAGECLADANCPGYWNAIDSQCEMPPSISCANGYSYSENTMRCEADPECEGDGEFNGVSFKCEIDSECDQGWTLDNTTGECTQPIDSVDPICNEDFLTWDSTNHYCDGYADFSDWSEYDPYNTGNWTLQSNNTEIYQSVNGGYPTFYVSDNEYENSYMEGKIKIDNDGDDDSVGIVFGLKDNTHYFLINWGKSSSGNSEGDYLLSLQKIDGESPSNHGGTGGTTLGGTNTGWSYNTWYDIKVVNLNNKVSVYIDGTLKFSVDNISGIPEKGKLGFYNQSQSKVHYKDFYIATMPTCPTGYTYNVDYDYCYKEYPQYISDYEQNIYRMTSTCPFNGELIPGTRTCEYNPQCSNNGLLDIARQKCYLNEDISCVSGLTPTNGISFENCDMSTICPTGYSFDQTKLLCVMDFNCNFVDPITGVCYESMNALCSSPTAVVEPSTNFNGYTIACADQDICPGTGIVQQVGNNWKCVDNSSNSYHMICPVSPFGWNDANYNSNGVFGFLDSNNVFHCEGDEVIKWESSEGPFSDREGPICKQGVGDTKYIKDMPLQDYQTNSNLISNLPEYNNWTGDTSDNTCVKRVNVFRCPMNSTSTSDYYTAVPYEGEYTGAKVSAYGNSNVACEADIDYAENIWRESRGSRVVAASTTCTSTRNNTHTDTYHDVCYEYEQICTGYEQVCNGYEQICDDDGNCTDGDCNSWEDGDCNAWEDGDCIDLRNEYYYSTYTAGTFQCVNNAGTSYGSGSGSLGNMPGADTTRCTGTYGTTGVHSSDNLDVTYDSSLYTCTLYDKGNFTWAESCPAGYVFNYEPNGYVTPIPSDSRDYDERYNSSSSNFNSERCYKIEGNADIIDFDDDKYLTTSYQNVQENYKIPGYPECNQAGYGWDNINNVCVTEPICDSPNIFEESDGKCESEIQPIQCSTGYTFNQDTERCEKHFQCPEGGTPNNTTGQCELRIQDSCLNIHIDGYDQVCANTGICPTGSVLYNYNGNSYCKSDKSPICPENYILDPNDNTKCISVAKCADGWVESEDGTECVLNYKWYSYTCSDSSWEGPKEEGADCHGKCAFDGCSCNASNPPANNCKQSYTLSTSGNTYDLYEKRRMQLHVVNGETLSPNEMGDLKDIECGEDCLFDVNKIVGDEDQLCFYKPNNESTCFTVQGCYFDGELKIEENGTLHNIKSIDVLDSHTLGFRNTTVLEMTEADLAITGSVRFVYDQNHGFDYSEAGTSTNYSDWGTNWKNEGFSLARTALKLSDGNWYVKSSIASNDSRGCGYSSSFKTISDSSYHVATYSNTCYAGTTNVTNGCALDLTIDIPNGLSVIGISDIESVAATEFQTSACNGDNAYDESFTMSSPSLNFDIPVTRVGRGTLGSASINLLELACPYTYDPVNNTCRMVTVNDRTNSIVSSCVLNGHVGWDGRSEGIVSVGAGAPNIYYANLDVNGTADYNLNNVSGEGDSNWDGFNIGTMAIKLSDGNWYVSQSFIDENGNIVDRGEFPSYIKYMPNSLYQIDNNVILPDGTQTVITYNCNYKGHNMKGYCGNKVKIIMPKPQLEIVAIEDIESLIHGLKDLDSNGAEVPATENNSFDLQISVENRDFTYQGTGQLPLLSLVSETNDIVEDSVTLKNDTDAEEVITDRLVFWDSFKDGDIGFIEFSREVKDSDRIENFVPEYEESYEAYPLGFTAIEYDQATNKTIFVRNLPTTASECSNLAAQIENAAVVDTSIFAGIVNDAGSRSVARLGGLNTEYCTIAVTGPVAFSNVKWAVRKNTYEGTWTYKCSPYNCNASNNCILATCPIKTIDNTNYEYFGTVLPASLPVPNGSCTDQVCDGTKDFIDYCGREIGCDQFNESTFVEESTGNCYEYYCDQGMLNTESRTCEIMACPQGTSENSDGTCSPL